MSKLDETNAALDAGKGVECREIGASSAAVAAETHAPSVAFDGRTSVQTNEDTNTHTHQGRKNIFFN